LLNQAAKGQTQLPCSYKWFIDPYRQSAPAAWARNAVLGGRRYESAETKRRPLRSGRDAATHAAV